MTDKKDNSNVSSELMSKTVIDQLIFLREFIK